jgi:hypothetical protein
MSLQINIPAVVAEVTDAFMRYQQAVDDNDVGTMNVLFWEHPNTVRFAPNGTLIGHAAIAAFRRGRGDQKIKRIMQNTVITTFGQDFATTNTESVRKDRPGVSRQSQSWVRTADGWRIAAAHVSDMPSPETKRS